MPDLPQYGAVPAKGPALKSRLFMVFIYIWQKDVAKISNVPGAQRDVNPARQ